jgi:hypothetical protein
MIATQEELDWRCYRLYGLLPAGGDASAYEHPTPPEVALGERAFEIVLARRIAAGTETTTWFERHGSTPVTEIPVRWPEDYRQVVQRRIDLIENDRNIGLIERPEYKRRWNTPSWESLEQAALRDWLLARLESPRYWPRWRRAATPQLTVHQPAGRRAARRRVHADRRAVRRPRRLRHRPARRRAGRRRSGSLPAGAALHRHRPAQTCPVGRHLGPAAPRRCRRDLIRSVGKIPVPPKYQSKDFLKADFWRLRGGLDVPKERWISYPGCERGADGSLVIAWAGWDHLQQATALATYFIDMKEREGWSRERLQPLLAGLLELVPWLKQWHNDMNPDFGARMGDYYESFVTDEKRDALQFTLDDLRAWKPAATASAARR